MMICKHKNLFALQILKNQENLMIEVDGEYWRPSLIRIYCEKCEKWFKVER